MKTNKEDKEKVKEPFEAQETPAPPQVMEPNKREEPKNEGPDSQQRTKKDNSVADTGRRLGESPTEIDDETTI